MYGLSIALNSYIVNSYNYTSNIGDLHFFHPEDNDIQKKQMSVLENKNTGETIKLRTPILFKITTDSEGIYYENEEYNIYACGHNQDEVEHDVYDEFISNYKAYAKERDELLDEKAQKLKYKILNICGAINA